MRIQLKYDPSKEPQILVNFEIILLFSKKIQLAMTLLRQHQLTYNKTTLTTPHNNKLKILILVFHRTECCNNCKTQ